MAVINSFQLRLHLIMFYNSKVYQTLLFNPFNLVNQFNVVYLNYSSIPAWAELGPAQPQLVHTTFRNTEKELCFLEILVFPKYQWKH